MIAARTELMRERTMAMAVAFGDPDQIEKLYPKAVEEKLVWWGDLSGR